MFVFIKLKIYFSEINFLKVTFLPDFKTKKLANSKLRSTGFATQIKHVIKRILQSNCRAKITKNLFLFAQRLALPYIGSDFAACHRCTLDASEEKQCWRKIVGIFIDHVMAIVTWWKNLHFSGFHANTFLHLIY